MKLTILRIVLLITITFSMLLGSFKTLNNKSFLAKSSAENLASVFALSGYLKSKSSSELLKTKTFTENKNNLLSTEKESSMQMSLMQGWLKYLEMNDSSSDVPSTFNKNNMYFLQMQENPSMNTLAKDNIGFLSIPNDQYHYFELTQTSLKIYSARPGKYRKFKDSLQIAEIIPLVSVSPCKGGMEDVGSFAEGFCFLVKFIKFSKHYIWELCADNIFEKNTWINHLIKVISGASPTPIITATPIVGLSAGPAFIPAAPPVLSPFPSPLPVGPVAAVAPGPFPVGPAAAVAPGPFPVGPVAAVAPVPGPIPAGYALVQDWSPCSRPCDTGVQTRMLDCIDINICMGKKLEERLCNTQKCKEDIDAHLDKLKKVSEGQWEYLGTWTKCSKACGGGIRTITRRCIGGTCEGEAILTEDCNTMVCQTMIGADPNKMEISVFEREVFDECKLLEGNLVMMIGNSRVLTHVEVNTQEIQIIKQDDPLHPIAFPLSKLMDVRPATKAPGCLEVVDNVGKNIVLCADAVKAIPCDLWIQRIRDFKTTCAKRLIAKMEAEMSNNLKNLKDPNASMNKINSVQEKIMNEQKLKQQIKSKALDEQFEEFKRQSQDLLAKEDIYEKKIEQQEEERLTFEQRKMQEEVKRQTESMQRLLKEMKEMADTDAEYKIKEMSVKREMKKIMNEVQEKINAKRTDFVNKMERRKNIHELTQKKAALELMDAKKNLGKQLTGLAAKGDPNQCFTRNPVMQNDYCTKKFANSFDMQLECKKPKQFCYLCCDKEIPALEKANVACCYKKCDDLETGDCRTFSEVYTIHANQIAFMK